MSRRRLIVSLPEFLVGGSDLGFREFVADLYAALAGMQVLRRALAGRVRLSAAEFSVLLATWYLQRRGRVSIRSIAAHLHVAAANVTADVGKLIEKQLAVKNPHPDDTRAVDLSLTAKGEAILDELAPVLRRINDKLFAGNTTQSIAAISNFLRHVANESTNSIRIARQESE